MLLMLEIKYVSQLDIMPSNNSSRSRNASASIRQLLAIVRAVERRTSAALTIKLNESIID